MKQFLMRLTARMLHTSRPLSRIAPSRVRRILILRLDHVGDLVLTLPAIRGLKKAFPLVRIDVVVTPATAALCRACPWIDEVIVLAPSVIVRVRSASRIGAVAAWMGVALRLSVGRYDVALDPRGEVNSRLLARISGAKVRIGTEIGLVEAPTRERMTGVMTHLVARSDTGGHIIDHNLAVASTLTSLAGLPPLVYEPAVWEAPGQEQRVASKLAAMGVGKAFAAIQAGSNQPVKRWGSDRWAQVAVHLIEQFDIDILLTGSRSERKTLESLRQRIGRQERVFNIGGQFTLAELFTLFRMVRIVVAVDTGPVHIAAMTGAKCVVLMLPYYAEPHHPYGQRDGVIVAPLEMDFWDYAERAKQSDFKPLLEISVDQVNELVDKRMEEDTVRPKGIERPT